jgi:endonuclease-3
MVTGYGRTFDYAAFMRRLRAALRSYGDTPVARFIASKKREPYRVLFGTLLSARTKDDVTNAAGRRLFDRARDARKLAKLSEKEIAALIYPVGFYNTKARHLKAAATILANDYNGLVPDTMDDLLRLPGVGRKTANLVLGEAFGKHAICVDTHVHRISNRIGLVKTKTPGETELDLAEILPKRYWIPFNTHLVAHGQAVCKPISPLCSECRLTEFCQRLGVKRSR